MENKKQAGKAQENRREELFCLPRNYRQVGQEHSNIAVYIEDYVMSFVHYIGKNSTEEVGIAVLIGEKRTLEKKNCVFIYGAVLVQNINLETKGCFSKEIWEKIYREIEENFKNKQIVGWMVTRAGINMEPGKQLEQLHLENFSGKDKVLLLYDTLEREECFFVYRKDSFIKLEGYCIYYDKNPEMQEYMLKKKGNAEKEQVSDYVVEKMKKKLGEMENRQKKQNRRKRLSVNIVVIGGIVLCAFVLQQRGLKKQVFETVETFKEEKKNITQQLDTPKYTKAPEQKKKNQTAETKDKKKNPEETNTEEIPTDKTETVSQTMQNVYGEKQYYTIQPGDTLVSICMKEFSSLERMDEIMRLNSIQDKNKIVAGQRLKLYE